LSSITTVLDDAGQATENVKLVYVKGVPMNPKLLDAGLAERLWDVWLYKVNTINATKRWEAVATEVRKIVKEATKEGK